MYTISTMITEFSEQLGRNWVGMLESTMFSILACYAVTPKMAYFPEWVALGVSTLPAHSDWFWACRMFILALVSIRACPISVPLGADVLRYEESTQISVVIPKFAPLIHVAPGSLNLLFAGMHVVLFMTVVLVVLVACV